MQSCLSRSLSNTPTPHIPIILHPWRYLLADNHGNHSVGTGWTGPAHQNRRQRKDWEKNGEKEDEKYLPEGGFNQTDRYTTWPIRIWQGKVRGGAGKFSFGGWVCLFDFSLFGPLLLHCGFGAIGVPSLCNGDLQRYSKESRNLEIKRGRLLRRKSDKNPGR